MIRRCEDSVRTMLMGLPIRVEVVDGGSGRGSGERQLPNRPELAYLQLHVTWTRVRWFLHRLRAVAPVTIHMPAPVRAGESGEAEALRACPM
jgi:hypothetical protein